VRRGLLVLTLLLLAVPAWAGQGGSVCAGDNLWAEELVWAEELMWMEAQQPGEEPLRCLLAAEGSEPLACADLAMSPVHRRMGRCDVRFGARPRHHLHQGLRLRAGPHLTEAAPTSPAPHLPPPALVARAPVLPGPALAGVLPAVADALVRPGHYPRVERPPR
jgi:hypothetical protein